MSRKYLEIWDSSGSGGEKFRVVEGGYQEIPIRAQTVQETIDGNPDVVWGTNFEMRQYTLRVCNTSGSDTPEAEVGYGNLTELRRLWSLNNPNGTPSPILTITDHYDETFNAIFIGNELPMKPLSIWIDGEYSWFIIPVVFRILLE